MPAVRPARGAPLSPGERDLLTLAQRVTTTQGLADTLGVSAKCVKNRFWSIFIKLGLDGDGKPAGKSRRQAAVDAWEQGAAL